MRTIAESGMLNGYTTIEGHFKQDDNLVKVGNLKIIGADIHFEGISKFYVNAFSNYIYSPPMPSAEYLAGLFRFKAI